MTRTLHTYVLTYASRELCSHARCTNANTYVRNVVMHATTGPAHDRHTGLTLSAPSSPPPAVQQDGLSSTSLDTH